MDQNAGAVRRAVFVYRAAALLNVILTAVLFAAGSAPSAGRTAVFLVWLALGVYSLIRILSDVVSGERRKEGQFARSIALWEGSAGGPGPAMGYFRALMVLSTLIKLAVPAVLFLLFEAA